MERATSLPLGFGMALVQNEAAMRRFEAMTEQQKNAVVLQTRRIRSAGEMRQFVSRLGSGAGDGYTAE